MSDGKAVLQIVPSRPRNPSWKSRSADSEEKHEPASDVDAVMVDSLKALDPERPIREADIARDASLGAKADGGSWFVTSGNPSGLVFVLGSNQRAQGVLFECAKSL